MNSNPSSSLPDEDEQYSNSVMDGVNALSRELCKALLIVAALAAVIFGVPEFFDRF